MITEGVTRIVNYLDDFCLLGFSSQEVGKHQLRLIQLLFFFISYKKVSAPSTSAIFLGIIIDSIQLCLHSDKLEKSKKVFGILKENVK